MGSHESTAIVADTPISESFDFALLPSSFDVLNQPTDLAPFSLSSLSASVLHEDDLARIQSAIDPILQRGSLGFIFVDVESGRGVSFAPNHAIYGASSFKAPYALYVCETLVEPGVVSLGSYCSGYTVGQLIAAAVEYSDNDSFGALRMAYDAMGYDQWATSLGATDALYRADSWFPWYSAESSARIWSEMHNYLRGGTETALWLRERLLNTNVSYIRNGVGGEGVTVLNKAGWMADADPDFNSLSDAGIIETPDGTYIMSIMSGMPNTTANQALMSSLAAALFDAREALDLQEVSGA